MTPLAPGEVTARDWRCSYLSNRDGDTVTLLIDQGLGHTKTTEDGLRLTDVYAPELTGVGGADTRDYVTALFQSHTTTGRWPIMVRTLMTRAGTRERLTFGRYIGTVWAPGDPMSLNEAVNAYLLTMGCPRGTGYKP